MENSQPVALCLGDPQEIKREQKIYVYNTQLLPGGDCGKTVGCLHETACQSDQRKLLGILLKSLSFINSISRLSSRKTKYFSNKVSE
jgi:hypothetical protein